MIFPVNSEYYFRQLKEDFKRQKIFFPAVFIIFTGCSKAAGNNNGGTTSPADTITFAKGADIGWLSQMEFTGIKFYDNSGNQKDCIELLKSKACVGWHWFTYQDNDPLDLNTDPSNRDSNKGIVNSLFVPYTPLLNNMQSLNTHVYELIKYLDKKANK